MNISTKETSILSYCKLSHTTSIPISHLAYVGVNKIIQLVDPLLLRSGGYSVLMYGGVSACMGHLFGPGMTSMGCTHEHIVQ